MIHSAFVTYAFSSSHAYGEGMCAKVHGHRFCVRVAVEDDFDRMPSSEDLLAAVRALGGELHLRDLNVMLAPSAPNPQGIAMWFWEKLALRFPLSEVQVWQDDEIGWTLRRPAL